MKILAVMGVVVVVEGFSPKFSSYLKLSLPSQVNWP